MCDNDDSMDEGDYNYEYEEDGDEQQTDNDFDEYDYDNDCMKTEYSNSATNEPKLEVVPDGTYILKEYAEVQPIMEAIENDVSTLLNIDRDMAELLLQEYQWSRERLVDAFFADSEKVMRSTGIDTYNPDIICQRIKDHKDAMEISLTKASSTPMVSSFMASSLSCRICGDEFQHHQGYAMGCDHWFCSSCYTEYLKTQVGDGPICIRAKCPEYKCHQAVSRSVFEAYVDEEVLMKYRMYVTRNFIENSKNMKYCPSPECNKVAIGSGITRIHCTCTRPFCFRCGEEAHDPCSCAQLEEWRAKCQDESETANWILANTKKCSECRTRIEKNQGCNHMVCKICKHEFCWICGGKWLDHGQSTGGYYKCNRYETASGDTGNKSAADKAKAELDKYLHYYQRYHAHDMSLKFASTQREKAEQKMLEQQEVTKASWIDVQFVKQAVEQVIECRRVLKFTYALGFFLSLDDPGRQLFEHHQEMLEKNTDRLQEYTEEPLEKMDRANIVNLTRVTEKFLESMLISASNDLVSLSMNMDGKSSSSTSKADASAGASSPTAPSRSSSASSNKLSPRVTRSSASKSSSRR